MNRRFLRLLTRVFSGLIVTAPLVFTAFAQTDTARIVDNIRPVGQVCLAGQDCRSNAGDSGNAPAPVAAAPVPVAETPAAAPQTPTAAPETAPADTAFDAAATYQMSCFACHGSGAAGAPKTGDTAAWEAKMAKGLDAVIANAMNGINAMPAKGMCMTCSESDIRALVEYMMNPN